MISFIFLRFWKDTNLTIQEFKLNFSSHKILLLKEFNLIVRGVQSYLLPISLSFFKFLTKIKLKQ